MHLRIARHRPALVALLALLPAMAAAQAPPAQVMVLGTPHFDNPGLDYSNPRMDDMLSPRRQAEIEAVVEALAAWAPTRIAIEAPPAQDSFWNARYAEYRAGRHTLTRDEREQIGLRLAARLGHARVYGVDVHQDLDVGGVLAWAGAHGHGERAARIGAGIQSIVAEMEAEQRGSVAQMLKAANAPRADTLERLYLHFVPIADDTAYPGAQMVADWYGRNLKIFANVARVAQPGERVLVIMGAGHGPLLRRYAEESPDVTLVQADPYLERARPAAVP